MKLINPTDSEIDAAVAEKVAGWKRLHAEHAFDGGVKCEIDAWAAPSGRIADAVPQFSRSADAVLPLLERMDRWQCDYGRPEKKYRLYFIRREGEGTAATFPRAACLALLRAHGVEVDIGAPSA